MTCRGRHAYTFGMLQGACMTETYTQNGSCWNVLLAHVTLIVNSMT